MNKNAIPNKPKNKSMSAPTQWSSLNRIAITEIELKTAPDRYESSIIILFFMRSFLLKHLPKHLTLQL